MIRNITLNNRTLLLGGGVREQIDNTSVYRSVVRDRERKRKIEREMRVLMVRALCVLLFGSGGSGSGGCTFSFFSQCVFFFFFFLRFPCFFSLPRGCSEFLFHFRRRNFLDCKD